MRPVTLLTQSFLLVSSVVAVPAILQPRKDLAAGCTYITNLEGDITALSKEVTSLSSTDIISDIEAIVAEIEKLTEDIFALDAALSCFGLKTKRDSLSSPEELSTLQQRQTLPSVCSIAKEVTAEIESLTASIDKLLGVPSLDPTTTAEIEKLLDSLLFPLLPLLGC